MIRLLGISKTCSTMKRLIMFLVLLKLSYLDTIIENEVVGHE
jgi:hypothetical protein